MIKFLLLLLICVPSYAMEVITINKHINDKRDYQGLILNNGLKVLLISDPHLVKSAAAIDVAVGSFNDPDNRLGLAHFLEHMLDLGTEKYPEADNFNDFITEHGGHYNANTESEDTKYIFNIDANYLDESLQRFAQFFIDPLFNKDLIDRERNAIESEYRLRVKDDNLRMLAAMAATSNEKHPYHRFNIGNIETLSEIKGQPLMREALVDFFNTHYSADKMTLAIAGPQKINQLQALAVKYFNNIPQRLSKDQPIAEQALSKEFAQDLLIKALGDQRQLSLLFKLDSLKNDYKTKAIDFIIYLLEQTHKGSLKDYLWQNNWIIDYKVSLEQITTAQDVLKIDFQLSANGEKNIEEITRFSLQYIQFLAEHALKSEIFDNLKNARIRNANFKNEEYETTLVYKYGKKLQYLPMEDIVMADYFTIDTQFNAEHIKYILEQLNAHNMRRIYMHKNANTKSLEPWYKVGYNLTPYSAAQLAAWEQPIKFDFAIMPVNNLLPENFKIHGVSGNIGVPGLVLQSPYLQLWHKQDNRFKQPKVVIKFLLRCLENEDSVIDALKLKLTAQTIMDNLQSYNADFELAGVRYTINDVPQGINIALEMYSDKMKEILQIIAKSIVNVKIAPEHFENSKEKIKCNLLNSRFEPLAMQVLMSLFQTITKPNWSVANKLAHINAITSGDVQEYWSKLLAKSKITGLISGNITDVQAMSVAKFFAAKVNPNPSLNPHETYAREPKLVEYQANDRYGLSIDIEHHDHALASYFQTNEIGKLAVIKMILLNTMLEAPFYEQLRTQEQLGYVVLSFPHIVAERAGLVFIVESPVANPVLINTKINEFFKNYHDKLGGVNLDQFEHYKSSLKAELLQAPKSILEETNYYWSKLLDGTNDFNFKKELAAKLANIKLQDMKIFYKNNFLTNQKSANVLVYTKINQKNIAPDYIPINEK